MYNRTPQVISPDSLTPGNTCTGTHFILDRENVIRYKYIIHLYCFAVLASFYNNVLASVAQLDAPSDWRPGGRGFNPCRGRQHSFVEIDREIFSTVILSLLLIQEGQLSVSGKRICTILVNRLED